MISSEVLSTAFARNVEIIKMQTEGLTHQDSLLQLPFRSNCLNWVVGHVLTNRCNIIRLLGEDNPLPGINISHYERESDPIQDDGEGVLNLNELIDHLEHTQISLAKLLDVTVVNDRLQCLCDLPHVVVADVQRDRRKPDDVRWTIVRDNALGYQRLVDPPRVLMEDTDVSSPPLVLPRSRNTVVVRLSAEHLVDEVHQVTRDLQALFPDVLDTRLPHHPEAALDWRG